MNEDASTIALQEIAALLRSRVEQEDEVANTHKAMRDHLAKSEAENNGGNNMMANHLKAREDFLKQNEERTKQHEQRAEEQKREKERADAETRDFREKLLAEFARHNDLLERIAAQLKK